MKTQKYGAFLALSLILSSFLTGPSSKHVQRQLYGSYIGLYHVETDGSICTLLLAGSAYQEMCSSVELAGAGSGEH